MDLRRRWRIVIIGVAFLVAASACGSDESSDPGPGDVSATSAGVEGASAGLSDALASAEITIIDDPGDGSGQGLELWSFQVENMRRELDAGGGYLGAELDEVGGSPGGLPFSYLVAGWLHSAPTPIAESALAMMGDQDWEQAPSLVFPTAVLVLFVADAINAADESQPQAMDLSRQVSFRQTGVCSTLSGWVNSALDFIFDSLKVNAEDEGFLGWLGGIWNAAVDLAKAAVSGLIELLTAPIVALVTDALVVVGTLNMIAGILKPWDLKITPSSTSTRFAVSGEPDIEEAFVAKVDTGIDFTWPADVVDCANVAGLELPDPKSAEGSTVSWTVIGLPAFGSLIRNQNVIGDDNTATLDWVTGREESDKGDAEVATVAATARVTSKQIEELKAMLETLISAQVPVSPFGDIVGALFSSITPPIFDALAELTAVSGTASVSVLFHEQDDEPIMGFVWELRATDTTSRVNSATKVTEGVLTFEFAPGQAFDEPHPRYILTGGTVIHRHASYATQYCTTTDPEEVYTLSSANAHPVTFIQFDTTVTPIRYHGKVITQGTPDTYSGDCGGETITADFGDGAVLMFIEADESQPMTSATMASGETSRIGEFGSDIKEWTLTRVE